MRLIPLVPALILFFAAPSFGQEWIEYTSKADRFLVNFPGQPQVREVPYPTEYGLTLTARLHVYEDGPSRYAVTVVDYTNIDQLHAARVKGCTGYPGTCGNRGPNERRGALDYAAWNFIKRDGRVTYYAFGDSDRIEGFDQLLNPDRSRRSAPLHAREPALHSRATVPPNRTAAGGVFHRPRVPRYDGARPLRQHYSNQYHASAIQGGREAQGCENRRAG